jgi:hypothetical protein
MKRLFNNVGTRVLFKILAVVTTMTIGMPLLLFAAVGTEWLAGPLEFAQPVLSILAVGLFVWAVVEVARRVGRSPKEEQEPAPAPREITRMDEADLRLVLDSKDAVGGLRAITDAMQGAAPATQLLGLAAVADGLLNALPQAPQILDTARPLLVFYLPRVVSAAERLTAPGDAAHDHDEAAERLAHASALLGNALRASTNGSPGSDIGRLDQAVQALNVTFGKAPQRAAAL